MKTNTAQADVESRGGQEIRLKVAKHLNWVVDLSDLHGLPQPVLDTLMALDEDLKTKGRQLEATGIHLSHLGGREFPRLVALYGVDTTKKPKRFHRFSRTLS